MCWKMEALMKMRGWRNGFFRRESNYLFKFRRTVFNQYTGVKGRISSEADQHEGSTSLQVLTEDQKHQYEKDGFTIVPDIFCKDHIDQMSKVLDGYVEQSRSVKRTDHLFVLDALHTPDKPVLLRLRCISNHSKLFHDTICHPKLVEIVSDLIGPSIRYINQEKVNMKPPKSERSVVKWHQDWAFFPHTNDNLVTVCIAIDDSTRENGCLQVVPGSHKGPLYSHFQDGSFVSAITDPSFDPSTAVHVEVPAGGASFHHALTVHGSAPNLSHHSRRMLCLNYSSADAWPLLGVAGHEFTCHGPVDWERYCSTVVKGKASVFPRMKALPFCIPKPLDSGFDIYQHAKPIDVSQPRK